MMAHTSSSLVSTDWLAEHLGAPDLVILDASRHLPAAGRDPVAEFESAHIPGARFLDLASLSDAASPVPAAIPNAAQLAERLASLGIGSETKVVLYDDSAVKTSARGWVILRAHGFDNVAILDGGLAKWRSEGRALEGGTPLSAPAQPPAQPPSLSPASMIATKADMLANLDNAAEQVLDARGADRVFGSGIDPVHGGQNGRIPGSYNLPFTQVFAENGTFRTPTDLRQAFEDARIDLDRPVVTTCGSGVTASVLLFALHLLGKGDVRLYDGSWQEWEADPQTPKSQGPL